MSRWNHPNSIATGFKTCKRCSEGFIARSKYHALCRYCHKTYQSFWEPSLPTFPDPGTKAPCLGREQKQKETCVSCHVDYTYTRSYIAGAYFCPACGLTKGILHNGNFSGKKINADLLIAGFKVIVVYDVHRETHDGYCSDPGEDTVEDLEETRTYPLLKYFKNEHLDDDGNIIGGPINFYEIDDVSNCGGGCSGTSYKIKNIKVAKIKRKITLPE